MSDKQTIKAVLFDLDGTLLNTSEGIACSVLHTLSVMQLPSISSDEVSTFIGPPIQESLKRHFRLSDEDVQIVMSFMVQTMIINSVRVILFIFVYLKCQWIIAKWF